MRVIFVLLLSVMFTGMCFSQEIILTKDNTLILNRKVDGQSVSKLMGDARSLDANLKSGYPMYLFLDTPGGSIQAGLELIEFLKGINRPIHTVTLYAASMGWQIVQHLGNRHVLEYGVLMSHKARGGFSGEFGGGESQLDSRYDLWLRRLMTMDKKTVKRTNGKKTLKQYWSEYDNELWLTGAESVKNGYADSVVSVRCDNSLQGERKEEFSFMGFKVKLLFDKCPTRAYPLGVEAFIRTNKGYVEFNKFLSEGGKFGKNCLEEDRDTEYGWNSSVTKKAKKAELCAIDKSLTFEKVKEEMESYRLGYVKNKRNVIYMTFSDFAKSF